MIELKSISKSYSYGKSNATTALKNIDLIIQKGEMVAVIGPSGAGKSTLLHILGGLCKFDSGEYLFEGINVAQFSESKRAYFRNEKIGIVMQDFALVEEYTVLENVMIPLYFRRGAKNKNQSALSAIEQVGISHLKNKRVSLLSGGERQRCAIARCLSQNPSVILADEPTGQLDSENSKKIMELFQKLNESGLTIIIVTHDENVAKSCKRIVALKDGSIENDLRD